MPGRKITNEQIVAELNAGLSQRKIAEKYGMYFMSIYSRVARMKAGGVELPVSPTQHDLNRIPRKGKRKDDDRVVERCGKSDCKYIGTLGGFLICDFIGFMGHSRGCPPEGCIEYRRDGD